MIEEALRCFDKAIELMPSYAEAWAGKGGVLCMQGTEKDEKVITNLRRLFGFSRGEQGRYNKTIKYIDKAIELKPELAGAWLIKSEILIALKRDTEADFAFHKSVELNHKSKLCGDVSKNCSSHLTLLCQSAANEAFTKG